MISMKKLILSLSLGWVSFVGATCSTSGAIAQTTPTANFFISSLGVVVDTTTGLMWKRCLEGLSGDDCLTGTVRQETWDSAFSYVVNINSNGGFAGFTDWRIPNVKELRSIVEESCRGPAINEVVFPNVGALSDQFTSTPVSDVYQDNVWSVYFYQGIMQKVQMFVTGSSVKEYRLVRKAN